jgi:hypothetical protein
VAVFSTHVTPALLELLPPLLLDEEELLEDDELLEEDELPEELELEDDPVDEELSEESLLELTEEEDEGGQSGEKEMSTMTSQGVPS